MQKFYFINQRFECGGIPYTDLCIVYGISKSDFNKMLKARQKERLEESEEGVHGEGFYDRLEYDVKKAGGRLEFLDEDILLNS